MWIFIPRGLPCWITGTGVSACFPGMNLVVNVLGLQSRPWALSHLWCAGKSSPSGKGLSWGHFLVWLGTQPGL